MSTLHHIATTKTARVHTHGHLHSGTKFIWLVAHGYGFLSEYFIKKLEVLPPEEHFVIVPEALNRFYLNGLSGRVGASWMTTEDRDQEIADYISYLDKVYETFILHSNAKIIALGFSQGGATIGRWAMKTTKRLNNIVFWGASIPAECLEQVDRLNELHPYLLVGDMDEFISEEKRNEVIQSLINQNVIFSHIFYKGGHAILTEPLLQLCSELTTP